MGRTEPRKQKSPVTSGLVKRVGSQGLRVSLFLAQRDGPNLFMKHALRLILSMEFFELEIARVASCQVNTLL